MKLDWVGLGMRMPTLISTALIVQGNSCWGSWGDECFKGVRGDAWLDYRVVDGGKGDGCEVGGEGSIAKT